MGAALSEKQETLISEFLGSSGQAILMFDPDDSGLKCTRDCLGRLSKKVFVKAIDLRQHGNLKPHQMKPEELQKLLLLNKIQRNKRQ